jgi:hypothetical protein
MTTDVYKIMLPYGNFVEVSYEVFRSWTGARILNGTAYQGKRYFWKSNVLIEEGHALSDLCIDCDDEVVSYTSDKTFKDDVVCNHCQNLREDAYIDSYVEYVSEGYFQKFN